jgi:hypothetical protein
VPKKTIADRAANSAKYHQERIKDAWDLARQDPDNNREAPLTAAMRWLYAALAQVTEYDPDSAEDRYRHATEQIAVYAESVQSRIANKTNKK